MRAAEQSLWIWAAGAIASLASLCIWVMASAAWAAQHHSPLGQVDDGLQFSQGVSAAKLVADRAVGPVQPWSRSGPAQHANLVPQHHQPGDLGGRRPAGQDQPAAGPDEDQVKQANRHGRSSSPTADHAASLQLTSRADFWHPTGSKVASPRSISW
jgi:hypothetical protein